MPLPSTHAAMTAETDASPSPALASVPVVMAACVFDASAAHQMEERCWFRPPAVETSNHQACARTCSVCHRHAMISVIARRARPVQRGVQPCNNRYHSVPVAHARGTSNYPIMGFCKQNARKIGMKNLPFF